MNKNETLKKYVETIEGQKQKLVEEIEHLNKTVHIIINSINTYRPKDKTVSYLPYIATGTEWYTRQYNLSEIEKMKDVVLSNILLLSDLRNDLIKKD